MNTVGRLLYLLCIGILLFACGRNPIAETTIIGTVTLTSSHLPDPTEGPAGNSVASPDPSQTSSFPYEPTLNDELPLDGLVLAAHVYADNTCYDLGVYQDGHYSILSCLPDFTYPMPTGFLDEYRLSYLQRWAERFQSFEEPSAQGILKFVGNGIIIPEFSDFVSMKAMIGDIEWDAHDYIHKGGIPSAVLLTQSVLSNQLGIPLDMNSVYKFELMDFPDACLGVPEPGEACPQVVTQGFRIQLVAQGLLYEYRTDLFGYDIRQFGEPQVAPTPGPVG
jgi:hypothetical protein